MTEAEEQGLRSLAEDLAGAEQSAWQPRCVARAFATPRPGALVFTMQTWIDLAACASPLLEGQLPETAEQISDAVDAFGCGPVDLSSDEAAGLMVMMSEVVDQSFGMSLPMTPPRDEGGSLSLSGGFGTWLPILAALISQLGMSRADACRTPVGAAFALLAADKRNRGWMPSGATYAQRDVLQPVKAEQKKEASNG